MIALPAATVGQIVREACALEVRAFKPGNVSFASPGHGMRAEDFVASAEAMTPALTRPDAGVGERIFGAVAATREAVGCNTNLGIVLLLAPLAQAALGAAPARALRARLRPILAALSLADAAHAYAAIRLAAPGGLGHSARHDVHAAPQVSLLTAMQEAAAHDRIAHQYASDYEDLFAFGLPLAAEVWPRYAAAEWATVAIYLGWLARWPDTHIARKHGPALAAEVCEEARGLVALLDPTAAADAAAPARLGAFDVALKTRGINPGTSADLTVATLVAWRLQQALAQEVYDRPATSAAGLHPPRALAREFHSLA